MTKDEFLEATKDQPGDTVLLVPGADHELYSPEIDGQQSALWLKGYGYSEDFGEENTPEDTPSTPKAERVGKRVPAIILR